MMKLTLVYRDDDRTPVIFSIKEMARQHYDLDVEVVQIKPTEEFEAALFNGSADIIIEHLEYLYDEVANGRRVTIFSAPSTGGGLKLVVPSALQGIDDFKGETMAVRSSGQPHAVTLWLRMMGLETEVATVIVKDADVGRWRQWERVVSGDCIGAFISPLYVPDALAAGLKILDVPEIPIVGHFAQACLSSFPGDDPARFKAYVKASIHAICLMIYRRSEALEIMAEEPMKRIGIENSAELGRQFDSIVTTLKPKPYPTPQAIANSHEIAAIDFPGAKTVPPLSVWDLHWVKNLDDEGFIDTLMAELATST